MQTKNTWKVFHQPKISILQLCLLSSQLVTDQRLVSLCRPTEVIHNAGEGTVRLHSWGRRRTRFLRRWHHRSAGSLGSVVVERKAAGEKRVVSCQLHNTSVRRHPRRCTYYAYTYSQTVGAPALKRCFWKINTEQSVTHQISEPQIGSSSTRQRTVSQLALSDNILIYNILQLSMFLQVQVLLTSFLSQLFTKEQKHAHKNFLTVGTCLTGTQ